MILLVLTLLQPSIPEKMREALALVDAGDADRARDVLESILDESPEHGPARLQLGQLALAREDWEGARSHLEVAVRSSPQRLFLAWHLLGRARRATGERNGAKQAFEAALELAPEFPPPRMALAELAEEEDDLWTALGHYRRAADGETAYGALANLARRMGALELARCAVSHAGENGPAAYLSAVIEEQAGETERAIARAEQALTLGYENAAVYLTLGNLLHEQMRLSESIAAFEKAVAIDPATAESLASFALTSLTTEDYARLRALLERHVEAHPDSLNTLYGLGAMYLRENDLARSRGVFDRLAELVPNASQVRYNLAMVYARLEEKDLAMEALSRFRELKRREDYEWARQNAIHRLRLSRDEATAIDERASLALQVVDSGGSETDDLLILADALIELGRRQEAGPHLDQALEQSPYDPRVLEALGFHERLALLEPVCESSTQASAGATPSVLLLTLDTFRGDRLGNETPNLTRLGARGVVFSRARSPIPLTLPSHASILTGLYPPEHGVRDNGRFALAEQHLSLAEMLRERDYETAAFIGSFVLDRRFGLAQGFDLYDDNISTDATLLESPEAERSGADVVSAFEGWLHARTESRPFFAWVHLYDPHAPYEPPEPFASSYDGEIAYTDSLVARILDAVASSTLIAVVGDHGEGLGEHEEETHSLLIYNSTLHVPMILAGPAVPPGRRVEAIARTIDLPATLLDLLGLGQTLGRGKSLLALIEGEDDRREAYSESLYGLHHFGFSPLYGLETSSHRFIEAPHRELFDLTNDPGETRDLLAQQPSVSRELAKKLADFRAETEGRIAEAPSLDAETLARLESLGYVTSSAPTANLRDPKAEMETYHRVQLAQFLRSRGECRQAVDALATLVDEVDYPVPVAYETLGACLMELGDLDGAEDVFSSGLARGIESARFHIELGVIALRRRQLDRARNELRLALVLEPQNVVAHYHLGDVLRVMGRRAEAIASYREAVAINPRYVFAWNGLGMALAGSGEEDDALDAFRRVLELQPDEPRGHFNLAVQLDRMGLRDEARPLYERFLTIAPAGQFEDERERALDALGR